MTFTHNTVLPPDLRARVADDPTIGGGNLLPSLVELNPYPDEVFISSLTPIPYTDGETRTEPVNGEPVDQLRYSLTLPGKSAGHA